MDDLFLEDNSGDFVIDYAYIINKEIYNSEKCFFQITQHLNSSSNLYIEIRKRNKNLSFLKIYNTSKLFGNSFFSC